MERSLTEVMKITGLTRDALRYYDSQDFIKPKKNDNTYHKYWYYDDDAVDKLKMVKVLNLSGMKFTEIKNVIKKMESKPYDDEEARCLFRSLSRTFREAADKLENTIEEYIAQQQFAYLLEGMYELMSITFPDNPVSFSIDEQNNDVFPISLVSIKEAFSDNHKVELPSVKRYVIWQYMKEIGCAKRAEKGGLAFHLTRDMVGYYCRSTGSLKEDEKFTPEAYPKYIEGIDKILDSMTDSENETTLRKIVETDSEEGIYELVVQEMRIYRTYCQALMQTNEKGEKTEENE